MPKILGGLCDVQTDSFDVQASVHFLLNRFLLWALTVLGLLFCELSSLLAERLLVDDETRLADATMSSSSDITVRTPPSGAPGST